MKILLDYVFPITVIEEIPAASTAFLKQVCVVVKPKAGQEANVGNLYPCINMTDVAAVTDNVEVQQLFTAGMSKIFLLLANDLDLEAYLQEHDQEFYTVLISSDFADAEVVPSKAELVKTALTFTAKNAGSQGNAISIEFLDTATSPNEVVTVTGKKISVAMDAGVSTNAMLKSKIEASTQAMALLESVEVQSGQESAFPAAFAEDFLEDGDGLFIGDYEGVLGLATANTVFAKEQAAISKRSAFFKDASTGAKNMFHAFGKLLSNVNQWLNLQYIEMPFADGVDELAEANNLFNDKVSFVIEDDEFGKRLALFAAGAKAIIAPYILKNLRIDLQSRAVQWINLNQPKYTLKEASLLENRLNEDVIKNYIARNLVESGSIAITLEQSNFVASGEIEVPTPKALWRVVNQMTETN